MRYKYISYIYSSLRDFPCSKSLWHSFIYTLKYPQISAGQTGLSENSSEIIEANSTSLLSALRVTRFFRQKKNPHPTPGTSTTLSEGTSERSKIFFCKFWTFMMQRAWYFCSLEIWRKHINVTYLYLEHLEIFLHLLFFFVMSTF